jgi:hypothetical protein
LATANFTNAQSNDVPVAKALGISSASVTLDGLLNEPVWRDAPVITLTQQAPRPGEPTPFVTEVRCSFEERDLLRRFLPDQSRRR